jgi:hypothetical protein
MKVRKWLAGILVFASLNAFAQPIEESHLNFSRSDHQQHFFISSSISLASSEIYRANEVGFPQGLGALTAITFGVAKELFDQKFSTGDLEADALGALTGSLLSFTFHF